MIIDTHAHIYSPDETTYPPIVEPLRPPRGAGSPEHLRRVMSESGVDRAMMVQTTTFYGWDNSFTRDTTRQCMDWARAVYTLDPEHPHSTEILYALVQTAGMRALRTYPVGGNGVGEYDHPGNRRLWAAARDAGIVVNILIGHVRYAEQVAHLLRDFPEVPAVLDHCIALDIRQPDYSAKLEAVLELARLPNLNAKLTFLATGSAEEYPFRDMHDATRRIINAYGSQRCVWGSDFPLELWAPKTSYAGYLELFQSELGLTSLERENILGATAERLYFR